MNDDIFRPDGGEWVAQPRPVPEPAVAPPSFGETTINEAGTAGFAVDGTDAFAIEERPAEAAEVPVDTPGAPGAGNRLAVTVGAVLGGLLLVVVVGSSTGPRAVVGEAGSLRTEEAEVEPTVSTSSPTTDDDDELPLIRSGDRGATSRVDPRGETLVVATVTEDTTFDDEFFDDEFFDDEFFDDDFDDDDFFDDDELFDDDDFDDDPVVRPRRIPVVPGRPRVVVPPRTTTTTTIPETTTTVAETTTTESTTTTTTTTTTTSTTLPAPVWTTATSGLPVDCPSGVRLWSRANGLLAGLPGVGLFGSPDGASWVPLGADTEGVGEQRAFVQDPWTASRFWTAGADGVFRTEDSGTSFVELGIPNLADVGALTVHVPTGGAPITMLAAVGPTRTLSRSVDGGTTWTALAAQPPGTVGDLLLVDAQTAVVGTSSQVSRTTDGGATWTSVHTGAVTGAPVRAADGTISWLLAAGGAIRSTDGGLTWTTVPGSGSSLTALVQLPDGRLLAIGPTTLMLWSPGSANWTPFGATLPYPPTGVTRAPTGTATIIWKPTCGTDAVMRLADS